MHHPSHGQLALQLATAGAITGGGRAIGEYRASRLHYGRHALMASTSLSVGSNSDTCFAPATTAGDGRSSKPHCDNPVQSSNPAACNPIIDFWRSFLPVLGVGGVVVCLHSAWATGKVSLLAAVAAVTCAVGLQDARFNRSDNKLDALNSKMDTIKDELSGNIDKLLLSDAYRKGFEYGKRK